MFTEITYIWKLIIFIFYDYAETVILDVLDVLQENYSLPAENLNLS